MFPASVPRATTVDTLRGTRNSQRHLPVSVGKWGMLQNGAAPVYERNKNKRTFRKLNSREMALGSRAASGHE